MLEALTALAQEKGISEDIMLEALADALVTAYKRMPDAAEEALVEMNIETGEIRVIAQELDEVGDVQQASGRRPPTSVASPRKLPSKSSCSAFAKPNAR